MRQEAVHTRSVGRAQRRSLHEIRPSGCDTRFTAIMNGDTNAGQVSVRSRAHRRVLRLRILYLGPKFGSPMHLHFLTTHQAYQPNLHGIARYWIARMSSTITSNTSSTTPPPCSEMRIVWAECRHVKQVTQRINCPAYPHCVCADNPVSRPGWGSGEWREKDVPDEVSGLCEECRQKGRKKSWKEVGEEMGKIELRR
jgi:hypothetical protein